MIPQWLELRGHVLANRVHRIFVDERHCVSHVHPLTIDKSQDKIKERIIERSATKTNERGNYKREDDPHTETEYREVKRLVAALAA